MTATLSAPVTAETTEASKANSLPAVPVTIVTGGLLTVAAIHLMDLPGKEPSYLAWGYIGLIATSILLAAWLAFRPTRIALGAAFIVCAMAIAGFVLSRTTGLPNAMDDIGNWSEHLGIAALAAEAMTMLFAVIALLPGAGNHHSR